MLKCYVMRDKKHTKGPELAARSKVVSLEVVSLQLNSYSKY